VLETAGLEVQLVNASRARNLPGRPKTGKAGAQWIARLTEMGLLRPGFVPPPEIRALRQCTRQLLHLTRDRTRCWQRLEKTLEDAMCKLTSVISKLAGPVPGRAMIEAVIAGERDPQALSGLALTRMRPEEPELVKAFTGMRFEDQHAFAAAAHLRAIGLLDAGIAALEAQAAAHVKAIPAAWGVDAGGAAGPDAGLGPDAAVLPAAARPDEIPGPGLRGAIALIAEIGLGMSRFPAPDARVSWAGLAPVAGQSGPRKGRGKKGQGNSYARRLCTMAAGSAAGTATFPGGRHRRLASRPAGRRRTAEGQRRGRPLHPHHRLAPAQQPRGALRRPRPRPLREALRRQPQDPRPHPPARSTRPRRHRDPPRGRRLTTPRR
jgi:transposase